MESTVHRRKRYSIESMSMIKNSLVAHAQAGS